MRIAAMLLLLAMICTACERQPAGETQQKAVKEPATVDSAQAVVDSEWLKRAQRSDPKGDATDLVLEFAQGHPSEVLSADRASYEETSPYLNILSVNLDEDVAPEHLLFIGPDYANTMFYVIDQKGKQRNIVFEERVFMHNEEPELHVLSTPTKNKTFYRRVLNERGSGIWLFTDRFYRLIDGVVYTVLEVVEESNVALDPTPIFQYAEASISTFEDDIVVKYSYEFSPGYGLAYHLGIIKDYDELQNISLFGGEETVFYEWQSELKIFVPKLENSKLTKEKIDCFTDLANTELIVYAYKKELEKLLDSGTEDQKKVAQYLLNPPGSEL